MASRFKARASISTCGVTRGDQLHGAISFTDEPTRACISSALNCCIGVAGKCECTSSPFAALQREVTV